MVIKNVNMNNSKCIKKRYLEKISKLIVGSVYENRVSEKSFFEKISLARIDRSFSFKKKIKFKNKTYLKNIISALSESGSGEKVYLLTNESKNCGAYILSSINEFNSDFNFSDDESGIFSLVSEDFNSEMILDFYIDQNIEYMEIELYGENWSSIKIKN